MVRSGRPSPSRGAAAPATSGRRPSVDIPVSLTVNGKAVTRTIDARTLLVQFLREVLQLTGTHVGCDTAQCGACTVHMNGRAIKACSILVAQVQGSTIT